MIKRPKPGEDEDELLRMQEEFLREKELQNIQPAAQVTNLRPLEPTKRPSTDTSTRKPSKYAQSKGLKGNKRVRIDPNSTVMGDILEKNVEPKHTEEIEDDNVYYPKVIPSLLGDIVEKHVNNLQHFGAKAMPAEGFPVASKCNFIALRKNKENQANVMDEMDVDKPSSSKTEVVDKNLPQKSYMISSQEACNIHNENVNLLSSMTQAEILEEQKKLLSNLDPKLVEFIKLKRLQASNNETSNKKEQTIADSKVMEKIDETPQDKMVVEKIEETIQNVKVEEKMDKTPLENDSLWENDVLSHSDIHKWLHFESLEKDKLEWIKGIEESKKIKADEPYEARFNFKGYLLPYTIEYTEKTKSLFHHGDEPHRPGYSITELIELSRSTITQQRVMALNTIAGILEYYSAGTYKDIIEIPLSKLFFIIRISMDENKVIILEPALKAMRNLVFNRIDEASLDALVGFEEGNIQPCLENDKSEIAELDSKESELKDFHLAEIDLIAALLRTDILQRLYYILETIRPSFNCVQYCLQIITRLARDSVETAKRIVETDHLMETIIKNFVPTTSVNFVFDPQIVYKRKPVLAALKLFRILSLQSYEICNELLSKYDILKPISEYISSGVDRSYGLRIQIEAYSILSNILSFGLGKENVLALCPIMITALYKHIQSSDISFESSILLSTNISVILQLFNKLLQCHIHKMDSIKCQLYSLIQEGLQKWFGQLSYAENYTFSHWRHLCSALDCCKTILMTEDVLVNVLYDTLIKFTKSQGFQLIMKNFVLSSNLLSGLETKDLHLTKNLMTLGGSVIDSTQRILPILNILSPIPFLASFFKVLTYLNNKEISEASLRPLVIYLKKLGDKAPSLCDNWFTRMESDFVFNIVKLSTQYDISEASKDLVYIVANKLCYILRIDKKNELEFLFNNILFNKQWFTADRLLNLVNLTDSDGFSKALTSIADIKTCYNNVVNLNYTDTGPNIILKKWQEPILPRDWIYFPILSLYSKCHQADIAPKVFGEESKKLAMEAAAEKEFIISCSLEWILFNELCFPDLLNDIDVTDRYCRIMCVYLCDSSLFLDPKIKNLLQKCTQILFKKKSKFNFSKELVGLHNFQDFYTQILEQFQSVSYGDATFAACVLVPLAQKHDVKWRKLLWSEYAGCLRALDCPEDMLCYDLGDYLYPEEMDESLIKSYFQALTGNLIRPGTIAYKIASHHVDSYKKRSTCTS